MLVDSGGAVIGILAPTYTGKSGVSAGSSNGIFFAVGVDSYVLILKSFRQQDDCNYFIF